MRPYTWMNIYLMQTTSTRYVRLHEYNKSLTLNDDARGAVDHKLLYAHKSDPHLSVQKTKGRTTAQYKRHLRAPVFGPMLNSCPRTCTPISGRQKEQDDRQRTVERAKHLRGLSYSLLAMRGCEAATAVEHSEARSSCEGQVVCMRAIRKKWASAWCGKEVVEQCVRQRERDRRVLVRPMLDV